MAETLKLVFTKIMATSSFFRTITLNQSVLKGIDKQKTISVRKFTDDRLEDGKKALARFSPKRKFAAGKRKNQTTES